MSDDTRPEQLGDLELEILDYVWAQGAEAEITVGDVHGALAARRDIAYTTVMTVMTRLARRGALSRRKVGRAFVYQGQISREGVARSLVRRTVDRVLGGRRVALFSQLLDGDQVSRDELEALKSMVAAAEAELEAREEEA